MAYQTGQFSSIADLFSKLSTFLVTTVGTWTEDYSTTDRIFFTHNTSTSLSVAFRWDTGVSSTANNVGIYQHLSFISSGTDPGNHTDDSGNGNITGTDADLDNGRFVTVNDSGGGNYWFFEDDTYCHIVIENQTGRFQHFGFGVLTKLGTWTGGEYCYGSRYTVTSTGNGAVAIADTIILDGLAAGVTIDPFVATMHMESMPNQAASGKWGVVWGGVASQTGNDRAAVERANVQGGFRGGPTARNFARFGGTPQNGLISMYPINCYYEDDGNNRWYPIGYQPDVRGTYVEHYEGGDEVTVGSDTWVVFPTRFKTSTASAGSSKFGGIAYKKVTT